MTNQNTPKYNPEQLKKLLNNPNVLDVQSASSIVFNPEFKIKAVEQFNTGDITCREIFENAGFDTSMFHRSYPNKQIRRWRETTEKEGDKAFRNSAGNLINYRISYDVNNPEDVNYMIKMLEKALISQQVKLDQFENELRRRPRSKR